MSDKYAGGVKAGATSVSIPFRLLSTAGAAVTGKAAADLTAYYWRQGGSPTSITLSDLAAINSSYSSGGVKQADATNMPGLYRIDIPDAALATGADWVAVAVKCSGAMDYEVFIPLESVGNSETYARVGAPAGASIAADIDALPTANENADALLDRSNGVETGLTVRNALRLLAAALAGELSGAATTTVTIRNAVADSKDRITATVDSDGNRTAITYDLT